MAHPHLLLRPLLTLRPDATPPQQHVPTQHHLHPPLRPRSEGSKVLHEFGTRSHPCTYPVF
jgi:hypothetical protein